jgi:hypothetical protein
VANSPLERAVGFFKPLLDPTELDGLASYKRPGDPLTPGVNVWHSDEQPTFWHVDDGGSAFTIFAAVNAVSEVPEDAVVLAELHDPASTADSRVLWYPDRRAVVLPFDPTWAIDAYRREWYSSPDKATALPAPVLGLYYLIGKRLLPKPVKRSLRRSMAGKALRNHVATRWPLDDSTDRLQRLLLRCMLLGSGRSSIDFVWFWPDASPWAVALTHDVETGAGLANASVVAELESQRGLRSSFNLVPIDYEATPNIVDGLRRSGFEIGVHGYTHDGLLFSNWPTFQKRVGTINRFAATWDAAGFRSPATYRNPDWYRWLDFAYDSSFSNTAPCEPQPGGCASVFPYTIDRLVELPITLPQDHTLFELLGETDASLWTGVLDRIREANGMACVLTHPDPTPGYVGDRVNLRHYAALLDYVKEWGAWTPLPRDLAAWWSEREAAAAPEAARLEGASIAHAYLDGAGTLRIGLPEARRRSRSKSAVRPVRSRTPSVVSPPSPTTTNA